MALSRRLSVIAAIVAAGCGGGGLPVVDPLTASLVATRLSGTAPLAVLFDATSTTSATGLDTFRQVSYAFNFGDERGLTWGVSGLPKNTQAGGPIAAHVFDVPGTYTVQMVATDPSGNVSQSSVSITVQDPNAVYAGAKTVCISLTTDFTGCPAGAAQQSSLPSGTQWNGKRWLLHAGQDFTALGNLSIQDGNLGVQVSAFGTGANPIIYSVGVGDSRPLTAAFAQDVTIMNLATFGQMFQAVGRQVLFYRNSLTDSGNGNFGGFQFGDGYWGLSDTYRSVPSSSFYNPRELFFVENTVVGTIAGATDAFGYGAYMAWMGNDIGVSADHNLRITRSFKGFVGHNRLRGISATGGFHSLKLHAGGLTPYADSMVTSGYTWASQYNVVANNEFGSAADNNGWITAICPQNDQSAEGIEDVIVENNRYVRAADGHTQSDLVLTAVRGTYRGNYRADAGTMAYVFNQHAASLPANWLGPYFSQ